MIRIEAGSIFDSKCDLLVIPCDSAGGTTSSVFSNLRDHGLPTAIGPIPFGASHFREVSRYENANVIAYSASVDAKTVSSQAGAVAKIATGIKAYCHQNNILSVNVPLLGAGAGGLGPTESFNALRKIFKQDSITLYRVFCFSREAYQNITAVYQPAAEEDVPRPRVFLSYAGNDPTNAVWVKKLANLLLENGVNARLDVFHLKPGADLPQWMTNEVILANKVLLICDKHYMEKADFKNGGVGWETMIIQGDMLAQGDNKEKYIAIVREGQVEQGLPIYIRSKFALHWGQNSISGEQLEELVLRLFDCDLAPPIRAVPDYVKAALHKTRGASTVGG
jgi:hypothetical protein